MKRASLLFLALSGLAFLALAGCSGGSGATVTGVITNEKGEPVADAEVTFEPFDRDQRIGSDVTRTDSSGRFEIKPHPKKKGLSPGKYGIFVSKWVNKKTGQVPPPEEVEMEKAAGTVNNLLFRYSNREEGPQLTAEIKAGKNDLGKLEVKTK